MKHTFFTSLVITLIAITVSNADAAKLYKWVDAQGNISYQDQPPPKSGKILSEKEVASKTIAEQNIDNQVTEVVVYFVDDCELCDRLLNVLKQNKVPHIALPLEDDREAQSKILEKVSSIIVPTILIGEDIIQGGTEAELLERLRSAGFTVEDPAKSKSSNRLTLDQ